jgi:hypothetical protein
MLSIEVCNCLCCRGLFLVLICSVTCHYSASAGV